MKGKLPEDPTFSYGRVFSVVPLVRSHRSLEFFESSRCHPGHPFK